MNDFAKIIEIALKNLCKVHKHARQYKMKNMKMKTSESKTNFARIMLKGKKITNGKDDQTDIVTASSVNNFAPKIDAKIRTNNATINKNNMLKTVKKTNSNSGCQTDLNNTSRTFLKGKSAVMR